MHQYKKLGGGVSNDDLYETWEIKQCPSCKERIYEAYRAIKVSDEEIRKLT
jgi:hypothetical protein